MANLTADTVRKYQGGVEPMFEQFPMTASVKAYQGSAMGHASGNAKILANTDTVFIGFAERQADNSAGIAGAVDVTVRQRGMVELSVTGVTTTTAPGTGIYASDGNTFTTTSTSNKQIGKLVRAVSAGVAIVYFEATGLSSV